MAPIWTPLILESMAPNARARGSPASAILPMSRRVYMRFSRLSRQFITKRALRSAHAGAYNGTDDRRFPQDFSCRRFAGHGPLLCANFRRGRADAHRSDRLRRAGHRAPEDAGPHARFGQHRRPERLRRLHQARRRRGAAHRREDREGLPPRAGQQGYRLRADRGAGTLALPDDDGCDRGRQAHLLRKTDVLLDRAGAARGGARRAHAGAQDAGGRAGHVGRFLRDGAPVHRAGRVGSGGAGADRLFAELPGRFLGESDRSRRAARREPGLERVSRARAQAAVRPGPLLQLAAVLGLFGRRRGGPVRAPRDQDDPIARSGAPGPRRRDARPGENLDWNAFLGPARKRPFDPDRFFSWRRYWDYSGGIAADLFVHRVTRMIQSLGLTFPDRAVASGGKFFFKESPAEIPDTLNILLDYPQGLTVQLISSMANETAVDHLIRGHKATLKFTATGFEITPQKAYAKEMQPVVHRKTGAEALDLHHRNLLNAIRRNEPLKCDANLGYYGVVATAMGNLSYRTRKYVRWDAAKQRAVAG